MPLVDHLRELRRRLIVSAVAILLGLIPGWIWYPQVFGLIRHPFDQAVATLPEHVTLTLPGVVDPFSLQVQVAAMTALAISSPIWLLQLWRFITPGLHKHEKRWTYAFLGTALPLAAAGGYLGYRALPVGLELLLGFTPDRVQNLVSVDRYVDFVFKMVLAFIVGFLSPLLLVLLNLAGLLTAATIRSWWRGIVMGVMLFAAIATPTGDPFNMMLLGLPILLLIALAWVFAAINDWRRRRRGSATEWADDEASDLGEEWV